MSYGIDQQLQLQSDLYPGKFHMDGTLKRQKAGRQAGRKEGKKRTVNKDMVGYADLS